MPTRDHPEEQAFGGVPDRLRPTPPWYVVRNLSSRRKFSHSSPSTFQFPDVPDSIDRACERLLYGLTCGPITSCRSSVQQAVMTPTWRISSTTRTKSPVDWNPCGRRKGSRFSRPETQKSQEAGGPAPSNETHLRSLTTDRKEPKHRDFSRSEDP